MIPILYLFSIKHYILKLLIYVHIYICLAFKWHCAQTTASKRPRLFFPFAATKFRLEQLVRWESHFLNFSTVFRTIEKNGKRIAKALQPRSSLDSLIFHGYKWYEIVHTIFFGNLPRRRTSVRQSKTKLNEVKWIIIIFFLLILYFFKTCYFPRRTVWI